jgi:integral membrane protein
VEKTKTDRMHRIAGRLEGTSFLLLIFIAMPLKYMADWPWGVKVVGWAHGILFIAYLYISWMQYDKQRISLKALALCFFAALLPFGPFVLEKKLEKSN